MKVANFTTEVARVRREHAPFAPGGDLIDFVTIRIRTDEGIEGIGFAGFVPGMLTTALKATMDGLCGTIVGFDAMNTEAVVNHLLRLGGSGSPAGLVTRATAAIDVALWDIKGKCLGQPVYKLLGGYRDRVPSYASGFLWRSFGLEMLAQHGTRLVNEGFQSMKFRLGAESSVSAEIARMETMRSAVGPDVNLMVDVNQMWDVNRTLAVGREMAQFGIYWLEDPIAFDDFGGLAKVAHQLETPIAAGEYLYGIAPFRQLIEQRCVDIVMVDLLRVGGITQWMKVAHLAECYNLPIVTHLVPEVLAHTLAAVPNGLFVEYMPWSFPLFKEIPIAVNGEIVLPEQPGLGLEFAHV